MDLNNRKGFFYWAVQHRKSALNDTKKDGNVKL